MATAVFVLIVLLTANAVASFFIAFFWQTKVIFALGHQANSVYAYSCFLAGELFPDLHRKWLRAIVYVAISYAILFLVAGFLQFTAPEFLTWTSK